MSDKYYFFWKHRLSQWHMVNFEVNGITYCCAEQYMMHQKALMFKDSETAVKILTSNSPKEHQELGRTVKNFEHFLWDSFKRNIVYTGNYERFRQSKECRDLLFSTAPKLLVEASPYDRVWGVGLGQHDPRILDQSTWRGQNLLGDILTDVRDDLMEELNG